MNLILFLLAAALTAILALIRAGEIHGWRQCPSCEFFFDRRFRSYMHARRPTELKIKSDLCDCCAQRRRAGVADCRCHFLL